MRNNLILIQCNVLLEKESKHAVYLPFAAPFTLAGWRLIVPHILFERVLVVPSFNKAY